MIDTPTLSAFMAVAETGSFSAAAERLYITQPAISKRIALLEQQLEARLFDRVGRQIQLTEAGRSLLPRALQVLPLALAEAFLTLCLGCMLGVEWLQPSAHVLELH